MFNVTATRSSQYRETEKSVFGETVTLIIKFVQISIIGEMMDRRSLHDAETRHRLTLELIDFWASLIENSRLLGVTSQHSHQVSK